MVLHGRLLIDSLGPIRMHCLCSVTSGGNLEALRCWPVTARMAANELWDQPGRSRIQCYSCKTSLNAWAILESNSIG